MAGYVKLCRILGKGDFRRGRELLDAVAERMDHARKKHPVFAEGRFQALGVIHAEYREMEHAVTRDEGKGRERDEALDVVATCLRFWLGEHDR